jgi:Fe-S-cluster containining protein
LSDIEISVASGAVLGYSAVQTMAIHYECQRCTACCRWPGEVKVSDAEITALAQYLQLDEDAFIQQYARVRFLRRGLALAEKPDGSCIFLEGRDCRVQPVKPQQCRDFPNGWQNRIFQDFCRAKPTTSTS